MLAMVCEHLEAEGYGAVGAGRGADAITRLRSAEFDVVLTDLKMPDVNGMEVLRVARESRPDVPVILVTAFGTIETAIQAIRQGAYDYVTKPFALEEISLLVGRALEDGGCGRRTSACAASWRVDTASRACWERARPCRQCSR